MNTLQTLSLDDCQIVGRGVNRPEDVVVTREGDVWLSDKNSACARLNANGSLERIGKADGAPNGINIDRDGRIVIANFGGPEDGFGPLQRLEPDSGDVEILVS